MLRSRFPSSCLAILSAGLFLACSGGGGDFTTEDLCSENDGAFVRFVDKIVECTPELVFFVGALPSDAEISGACTAQFEPFAEDGTIRYAKPSDLDACIAAIEAADCETFEIEDIPACDDIILGTLGEGEACEANDQCEGDAFCDQPDDTSCGTCTVKLADGITCDDNDECASGKCRSNGACGPFAYEGDSCDENEDCVGQLSCEQNTCQPALEAAVGDSCDAFTQCGFPLSNMYCDTGVGECKVFLSLGADCFDGAAALGVCELLAYETCDFQDTRKCQAPTIVGLGEACAFQDGRKCSDGLLCTGGDTGVCVEQGLGASCQFQSEANTCGLFLECKSDGVCDYETNYTGTCPAES